MNKILITISIVVLLGIGSYALFNTEEATAPTNENGETKQENSGFISDLGAQKLAQGYLALVMDNDGWSELSEEGLKKNHGVSNPDSPCPDFFAPLILQFPEDVAAQNPPIENLALTSVGFPWLTFPVQVTVPADGRPNLPPSAPVLPDGFFSDPFFVNFNCNITSFDSQKLEGLLNIAIYNSDNSEYRPAFDIPVSVDLYGQQDYPADESIFTDGFESVPESCVSPGIPEEDCWNLIVFP
ncbi:MAG: hypothetical protein Q8Q20_02360 [bacterium]|nr:hypothetical protein [bacterium]